MFQAIWNGLPNCAIRCTAEVSLSFHGSWLSLSHVGRSSRCETRTSASSREGRNDRGNRPGCGLRADRASLPAAEGERAHRMRLPRPDTRIGRMCHDYDPKLSRGGVRGKWSGSAEPLLGGAARRHRVKLAAGAGFAVVGAEDAVGRAADLPRAGFEHRGSADPARVRR